MCNDKKEGSKFIISKSDPEESNSNALHITEYVKDCKLVKR
jgi:hypothetical protein